MTCVYYLLLFMVVFARDDVFRIPMHPLRMVDAASDSIHSLENDSSSSGSTGESDTSKSSNNDNDNNKTIKQLWWVILVVPLSIALITLIAVTIVYLNKNSSWWVEKREANRRHRALSATGAGDHAQQQDDVMVQTSGDFTDEGQVPVRGVEMHPRILADVASSPVTGAPQPSGERGRRSSSRPSSSTPAVRRSAARPTQGGAGRGGGSSVAAAAFHLPSAAAAAEEVGITTVQLHRSVALGRRQKKTSSRQHQRTPTTAAAGAGDQQGKRKWWDIFRLHKRSKEEEEQANGEDDENDDDDEDAPYGVSSYYTSAPLSPSMAALTAGTGGGGTTTGSPGVVGDSNDNANDTGVHPPAEGNQRVPSFQASAAMRSHDPFIIEVAAPATGEGAEQERPRRSNGRSPQPSAAVQQHLPY